MLLYVPGPEIVDAVGVLHAAVYWISFHVEPKECLFLHHVHVCMCIMAIIMFCRFYRPLHAVDIIAP